MGTIHGVSRREVVSISYRVKLGNEAVGVRDGGASVHNNEVANTSATLRCSVNCTFMYQQRKSLQTTQK